MVRRKERRTVTTPLANLGLNLDEQKAIDRFRKDVVEPSMTSLVILGFWAEWCGPCKALTPLLEKVAAEYADKGVVLAKINVDEDKFIAAQFQVRSVTRTPAGSPLSWHQSWDGLLVEGWSNNQTFSPGGHSGQYQRQSRVSGFVQSLKCHYSLVA